ncbi:MAG: hypothetical protein E7609_00550 [Ruminococcaceae bacterium]|nr:hypothetical protein [Oscillospiraceae bacterium]
MSDSGGFPDLAGILARVTENPQAMSMLSSLLGGTPEKPPHTEQDKEEFKEETKDSVPALASPKPRKGGRQEERRCLLLALKPFLSRERCQALETLLIVLDAIALLPFGKEPPCT